MPFLDRLFPGPLFPGLGTNAICEAFIVDQLLPDLPCELNSPSPLSAMRTEQQNIPPTAEFRNGTQGQQLRVHGRHEGGQPRCNDEGGHEIA